MDVCMSRTGRLAAWARQAGRQGRTADESPAIELIGKQGRVLLCRVVSCRVQSCRTGNNGVRRQGRLTD